VSTYICIFFSTLYISLSIQGHEILALKCILRSKNKRNPTREPGRDPGQVDCHAIPDKQTAMRSTQAHIFSTGVGAVSLELLLRYVYTSTAL